MGNAVRAGHALWGAPVFTGSVGGKVPRWRKCKGRGARRVSKPQRHEVAGRGQSSRGERDPGAPNSVLAGRMRTEKCLPPRLPT